MSHPGIRRYNYISDFYWTQNQYSAHKLMPAYPVTYYNIDWDNSVYDKDLMAGSYERHGVGQLSGMKWNKIQMLPVYWSETLQPQNSADEKGVTSRDSEITNIVIPTEYGLKSTAWDFVHFSQAFMFEASDFSPIYVVTNVDNSTHGTINYDKLTLKVTSATKLTKLETQISENYMFLELTKRIHQIQAASVLLKLQTRHDALQEQSHAMFHNTGFYNWETV